MAQLARSVLETTSLPQPTIFHDRDFHHTNTTQLSTIIEPLNCTIDILHIFNVGTVLRLKYAMKHSL
jgi:hypothetical protein